MNLAFPQTLTNSFQNAQMMALRQMFLTRNPQFAKEVCWPWPGHRSPKGYGVICWGGFHFYVHRLSFQFHKGLIPMGFSVMHDCDHPPCWNPGHLFLGTHAENMADMTRKGRARRRR